jgi:catechol 2,3-dioxygenase-like lactoylglutathione lyase family enzyme
MRLEHVNLTVSDLDRSIEFYRRLLGLRIRWRGTLSSGLAGAHVGNDEMYIALFQAPEPGRAGSDYEAVGLNHFGFVVDRLDECKRRLLEMGAPPHAEQDYDPGRRLYVLDPDGIEVELVEYDAGEATRVREAVAEGV